MKNPRIPPKKSSSSSFSLPPMHVQWKPQGTKRKKKKTPKKKVICKRRREKGEEGLQLFHPLLLGYLT